MNKNLSDIELHVAGATVRHTNPFETLKVPTNSKKLDIAFIEKWVKPFYQLRFRTGDSNLRQMLLNIVPEVTSNIVSKLLADFDWRTRITGARFAAIKKYSQYEDIIGRLLLKSEVCYAGSGYCLALASFNTLKSIEYIETYLDYYLKRSDLYFDQGDALAALAYLDAENGTNNTQKHLDSWQAFIQDKTNCNLESSKNAFSDSINFIQSIRDSGS